MIIFSFLLLRPSKSSGALKKDPTWGILNLGYALKKWALGRACLQKVSCIYNAGIYFRGRLNEKFEAEAIPKAILFEVSSWKNPKEPKYELTPKYHQSNTKVTPK